MNGNDFTVAQMHVMLYVMICDSTHLQYTHN